MKQSIVRMVGVFAALLMLGTSVSANQNISVESTESNRMKNKLGGYLSYSEPAPTLIGINLAYNVTDFLKASIGYGSVSVQLGSYEASAHTFGAGVRALVPGWNLSPTVGLHYGHIAYSGDGGLTVHGFNESGGHVYASFGVDWQTESGFSANGGYRQSFKSGVGGDIYLGAGWYVNWLG